MIFHRTTRRVIDDPLYGTQPVARIGSSVNLANQAARTAAATAGGYGMGAAGIGASLVPELQRDVTAPQGFSPEEQASMLTAGLEGAGGATSGLAGEAGLRAARSRNVGSTAGTLDELAREKTRASAGVGLSVAGQNAMLKQQQREQALKQLQGLYGTDVEAQLKAQGLVPEDVNAAAAANRTGWVQNVTGVLGALSGAGKAGSFTL